MTFEEFLAEKHADQYHGVDDDMPDDLVDWIGEQLGEDEFIEFADEYARAYLDGFLKFFEKESARRMDEEPIKGADLETVEALVDTLVRGIEIYKEKNR